MPFVSGFLRVRRRGGHPDNELPGGERPTDPDYGIEEGGSVGGGPILPDVDPPDPPPGLWPPLTPEHPWRPIDPGWGQGRPLPPVVGGGPARPPGLPPQVGGGPARPERPTDPDYGIDEGPPPGTIWPPLPPGVTGHYWALVAIGGMPGGVQYRYVVIDAGLRPGHGLPRPPARPDNTLPETPEPKPA